MKEIDRKWWIQIGWASSMGIAMAVSIALSVFIGVLLDRLFETRFFILIFIGVGILAAYRSMWHIYTRHLRD
jgi:hypothetical protein